MPVPIGVESRVKRQLRKDEVFELLLEAILDGTLEPGERIRDGDLAAWFGVSRTPIRLAVDRLAALRLIESRPNRYTRVCPSAPERIPQVLEVMCALWALAAREAIARMTPREARSGRALLDRAARACSDLSGYRAASAIGEMREALVWFSAVSANSLVQELVVKFGTSLRFQLAIQGPEIDSTLLQKTFQSLERAVGERDAEAAVALFERLGATVIMNETVVA